jgi:MerR family regulatory protein
MSEAGLAIGEVSRRAGVSMSAIRYYERNGLLIEPERVGGQRRYADNVIERLGIIDVAKRARSRPSPRESCPRPWRTAAYSTPTA